MKSLIGQTKIDELETLMSVQSNNFIRNKIETYWVHNHEITVKEHARARDQEPSPKDQVNCSIPRVGHSCYVSSKGRPIIDFQSQSQINKKENFTHNLIIPNIINNKIDRSFDGEPKGQ